MSKIVPFPNAKKRRRKRLKETTLCGNGNHKFQVDKATRFDVKSGKLVTTERCERCGETRHVLK